jgi:uncharacterized protein GlcG (DUF336 family)
MRYKSKAVTMLFLAATTTVAISAPTADEDDAQAFVTARILSAPIAAKIALEAERACKKRGYQVAVAVVDRFGNLVSFLRDPLSGTHTVTIAKHKAFTAATFQGATIDLTDRLSFLKGTPGLSLVGGGVPIRVGGYVYGAVGVSGAPREKIPGDIDDACAREGIASVQETLEFSDM